MEDGLTLGCCCFRFAPQQTLKPLDKERHGMENLIITNVSTYKTIAQEAYEKMASANKSGRTPKADGTGWILKYDPERTSFKSAMISIVFTGMWLEALLHLLIVSRHGEHKYREYDRKIYEEKLLLLGITDNDLIEQVKRFRIIRKELVHEKAHFDIESLKTAQDEAEIAHEVMMKIEVFLHGMANNE